MRNKLLLLSAFVVVSVVLWRGLSPSKTVDFMTDVKPLLNKKCMSCHGGVKANGGFNLLTRELALQTNESGKPAIIPGDADASEMIRRLTCTDTEERMPYKEEPLTSDEIGVLRRWINEGAEWGRHWAYAPLQQPALPKQKTLWGSLFGGKKDNWSRNPIDQYILHELEKNNLQPSPQADKATLLRRVCLDLTGLPPSAEQQTAFLNDTMPNAYERLVDTLLASPHYGERWTAMWLDLARYADSKGYERDAIRFMWRYRDWLIDAFNKDLPYDQFLIQQLAGDMLTTNPDDALLLATGFHRNTPTNDEGGTDNEEFRTAAVMDRVATTWEGLMGTTFACVQCHSHPYDPFFHEEYYQFAAFFNNSRDADTYSDFPLLRFYAGEDSLKFLQLKEWLPKNCNPLEVERVLNLVRLWQPAWYSLECDSLINSDLLDTKYLGLSYGSFARLPNVNLTGKTRLITRVMNMGKTGSGVVTLHKGSRNGPEIGRFKIQKSKSDWQWDMLDVPINPVDGTCDIWFKYTNPALNGDWEAYGCQIDFFSFTEDFPGKGKPGYDKAYADFMTLMGAGCETASVMWENPSDMRRKTHVFERGNWLVHGSEVQPKVPQYMPPMPEGQPNNRLGLAHWLTQPEHPLTARVMANRLWEQLFGIGIVESIEDFGTQGTPPSHPELLDWLAWQYSHDLKWSTKQMLRMMVLSATYQQSSATRPDLNERDPQNRLLARGARVRLASEQMRDQALVISGLFNPELYGKPVMPWQPDGIWQSPWNGEQWKLSKGDQQYRRAIYTYWKRSSPYPSNMTMDAAGRQVCTARRIRTNTPLQALTTLNDPVYVECARHFALKMNQLGGPALDQQIRTGYRLATGRDISTAKLQVLSGLYAEALRRYKADPQATQDFLHDLACDQHSPELAALGVVANALLNLDEVVVKT
jgi:hypothetical protein